MVGTEQRRLKIVEHVVPEAEISDARDVTPALQHGKVRIQSDLAENHNNSHILQQMEFALEIRAAVP